MQKKETNIVGKVKEYGQKGWVYAPDHNSPTIRSTAYKMAPLIAICKRRLKS